MITAAIVSSVLQKGYHFDTDNPRDFAMLMIITVSITTVVWLATTFLTKPEPEDVLVAFYARTRPSAAGWGPIAKLRPDIKQTHDGWANCLDWISGCALIYGVLFGTGKLLLHENGIGLALLAMGLAAGAVIYWDLSRRGWSAVVD